MPAIYGSGYFGQTVVSLIPANTYSRGVTMWRIVRHGIVTIGCGLLLVLGGCVLPGSEQNAVPDVQTDNVKKRGPSHGTADKDPGDDFVGNPSLDNHDGLPSNALPSNALPSNVVSTEGADIIPALRISGRLILPEGLITPEFFAPVPAASVFLVGLHDDGGLGAVIAQGEVSDSGDFSFSIDASLAGQPFVVVFGNAKKPLLRSLVTNNEDVVISVASELAFTTLVNIILPKYPEALTTASLLYLNAVVDALFDYFADHAVDVLGSVESVIPQVLALCLDGDAKDELLGMLGQFIELAPEELKQAYVDAAGIALDVTPPGIGSIALPAYCASPLPVIAVDAGRGAAAMRFARSEATLVDAAWLPVATTYDQFDIGDGGDGRKQIYAQFKDEHGNEQPKLATASCVLDTIRPGTKSDVPPSVVSDASGNRSVSISFFATEEATFLCSLNGQEAVSCTSPVVLTSLIPGAYQFGVWATDLAGNQEGIALALPFDVAPPASAPVFSLAPEAATTSRDVSFSFSTEHAASVSCALDDNPVPCDLSGSLRFTDLPDGDHHLVVIGMDYYGAKGPAAEFHFTVDATGPTILVLDGPPPITGSIDAQFSYSSDDPHGHFMCSLDDGDFAPCDPGGKSYSGLSLGQHTFKVYAMDQLGNIGPDDASITWLIDLDLDDDGAADLFDSNPADKFHCADADLDGCDECASGEFKTTVEDGPDLDRDGLCDGNDGDTDGDGLVNVEDSAPMDRLICADTDNDTCDDCSRGEGAASPSLDGPDADQDGMCDASDTDDDNDGFLDTVETDTGTWVSSTDTGTDPLKADTDGDGSSDASEPPVGRNPNVSTFWKKIPGLDWNTGYGVVETDDGGFVTAGSDSFSPPNQVRLVKCNAKGDVVWDQHFGTYPAVLNAYALVEASDGGFVIAGRYKPSNSGTYDVLILKTDATGQELWRKTHNYSAQTDDTGLAILETADFGFVIAATGFGLIKVTQQGDLVWNKPSIPSSSVQFIVGGGYIVAGNSSLTKTDASGDQIWAKTFSGDVLKSPQQTSDGGYVVTGYTDTSPNYDVVAIKTDASGVQAWRKTFGQPGGQFPGAGGASDAGRVVLQTEDGGYLMLAGTMFHAEADYLLWLIKVDSAGTTQWSRTFKSPVSNYGGTTDGRGMQLTSDGGVIITGLDRDTLLLFKYDPLP